MLAYTALLALQIGIIALLVNWFRVKNTTFFQAANLFQPLYWTIAWFVFNFLIVQLILPFYGIPVLGLEGFTSSGRIAAALKAQVALCVFLGFFLIGSVLVGLSTSPRAYLSGVLAKGLPLKPARGHIPFVLVCLFFIGLSGFLFLYFSFDAGPRSDLVKTTPGKLAYALAFAFTYTGAVLASTMMLKKKRAYALLVVFSLGTALLLLGGRGRVLWPLVHTIVFLCIFYRFKLQPKTLLMLLATLFVLLASLDPIFLYIRGDSLASSLERFVTGLNFSQLFLSRTFDGFQNLAVITYLDRIPHSLHNLTGGSGEAFMETYFPEVLASGVGFPPTLLGEAWMAAGWSGLCFGGLFAGILIGVMHRFYWSLQRQSALWLYIVAVPILTNFGTAYIDQLFKTIATILPPLIVFLLDQTELSAAGSTLQPFSPLSLSKDSDLEATE